MKREKKTMDGNQAAAHVSYAYTETAAIYPITPSSTMAEYTDEWATEGRKNIFGHRVLVSELQSEAGAAGAVHGALIAGALTATFTSSQGLLLMIPNLYRIAGELLPGVFHVAARTVATHALSIFGDHSDIYACRQTGVAMLCESSVQQVMDLSPVAHLAAIRGRLPFINFFDGFRTSHEMQKIETWDYEDLKTMVDWEAIRLFRENALNPNRIKMMGSAQNPDIYFQAREASNPFYDALPGIVENYMKTVNEKIGTDYGLFNYYGAKDASHVVIAMGSVCETIRETVDYLNERGERAGLVEVHLYRPFSAAHLLSCLPAGVEQISVLDRTKEPGAPAEPLYLDVVSALRDTAFHNVRVSSGRYGLSSKNTTPEQILAVYKNAGAEYRKRFTLGITDDVTGLSLPIKETIDTAGRGTVSCKFWGLGGDGTVSANKNSVKIIGNHTDRYVQAYFEYDSKKSRGLTISHLRFGDQPIRSEYLVEKADLVACHNPTYLHKYDMVQDVKDGGIFLLNCYWKEQELEEYLPGQVKQYIAAHRIRFYIIDAIQIGKEIGLNSKISTILQAAFFSVSGILPPEEAATLMKEAAKISYQKKGEKVIRMNYDAIDRGMSDVVQVRIPEEWERAGAEAESLDQGLLPDHPEILAYVTNIQKAVTDQKGNSLPVSAFLPYADGSFPHGSTAHERRNVTTETPVWKPENCIQCNRCSYVCPHAVVRPSVMTAEEKEKAPKDMASLPMTGMQGYEFAITISPVDCTGCGSCVGVCPGKKGEKALEMCPIKEHDERQQYFDYGKALPPKPEAILQFKETTVKGSQFKKPLMEFSGACAGCGETPYARLVTQLFGERMYIANATGCSSIWANSSPSTAYTVTWRKKGPAWSNSLFEDGAEFGYGMLLAQEALRERLKEKVKELADRLSGDSGNAKGKDLGVAAAAWLHTFDNKAENEAATIKLVDALAAFAEGNRHNSNQYDSNRGDLYALKQEDRNSGQLPEQESQAQAPCIRKPDSLLKDRSPEILCKELLEEKDFLSRKSQWVFGGDGWAYDIGFGGLDHVLSSGADINVLIFDTEVYSNTGGQASKATPTGAFAKFTGGGKERRKKDLAAMAMSYGYVYVAQIAMGADYNQTIKALVEAESYNGPSLIIAYSPCISHGIRSGMGSSQHEEKKAVDAGYFHLFRYNPSLKEEGKNPFILDSKEPSLSYGEFLAGENRYDVLKRMYPERAERLFKEAEKNARERWEYLKEMAERKTVF